MNLRWPLLEVGGGRFVPAERVVAIVGTDSAPVRRLIAKADAEGRIEDLTGGRPARAVVILGPDTVALAPVQPETIVQRYATQTKAER